VAGVTDIGSQDAEKKSASLSIGAVAPSFSARTTMGQRALSNYGGRWLVFFSHPADFTPVCTSEFIAFSKAFDEFQALGCDLLALSVDSLFSHVAWVRAIATTFGVTVQFPIAEDPSMAIAGAYGMIGPGALDSATVRATFVIDPDRIIRAIIWYPMSIGRSVAEILRLVQALQVSDQHAVSTPEGWRPGGGVIDVPSLNVNDALGESAANAAWFYQTRKLEKAS
jgi:peroxiredoxin 2/4